MRGMRAHLELGAELCRERFEWAQRAARQHHAVRRVGELLERDGRIHAPQAQPDHHFGATLQAIPRRGGVSLVESQSSPVQPQQGRHRRHSLHAVGRRGEVEPIKISLQSSLHRFILQIHLNDSGSAELQMLDAVCHSRVCRQAVCGDSEIGRGVNERPCMVSP